MKENMQIKGNIKLTRVDNVTGKIIDVTEVHNVVTDLGKERVAKLIGKISTTGFEYIAIGTGTTGELSTDTTLETELDRQLASSITEPTAGQVKFEKTFTFASNHDISEVGLFELASAGLMFNRATVSPAKSVSAVIDLIVSITVTVS